MLLRRFVAPVTALSALSTLLARAGTRRMSSARARFLAQANLGQSFLKEATWAVIGDVLNTAKPASDVVASLRGAGKTVHLINPRDKTGECQPDLNAVGSAIDVVDLCIRSDEGLRQVEQMGSLGIKKVWIQPGAESADILRRCKELEIEVFQGCVMVELGVPH